MKTLAHLDDALAAIDEAADAKCDAIKLGVPSQLPLPLAWCTRLFQRAEARGIVLLARPDDEIDVTRLDWVGARAYDLAFDLSDLDLIAAAARTGKPIFLSVGRATREELAEIVTIARRIHLIVPVYDVADLGRVEQLMGLDVPVGIADSQTDAELALAGIARGASIVEKRRCDRSLLSSTIRHCELAWSTLGHDAAYATN